MKAALILICSLMFTGILYSMAYVTHYCTVDWHCGADIMMLIIGLLASVTGIFYAMIEL
jgi:hypothetical protein